MQERKTKMTAAPKWEEYLRKGMFAVGRAVEHVIGRAEKIGADLKKSTSFVQPLLSLEGQIPIPKLKELINQVSDKNIAGAIPGLVDRTALEVREGQSVLAKLFKERGASVAIHIDIGGGAGSYGRPEGEVGSIRGVSSRLPFEDGFFDYIVGLYASQYQGDIVKSVKEFSRLLSISGEGVVVDFHPFGMYAKRGALRLKPISSTVKGIEDYYKMCRLASLKIISVRESFFDETVRQFFVTEDEKSAFRIVKDTPMLIYLFVKKGG